jgi:hypothetical protein
MTFSEPVFDTRSTISAPAPPTDHNKKKDVPDFTEFKLEGFKMNSSPEITPAPHRLREARRSLCLYLEPNPETPIQTSLQSYQEKTFVQFGPNQAHNTKSHISVLSRVLIERGSDFSTKWDTVDEFLQVVDEQIQKRQLKAPHFTGFEILDKPTRSLVINVRVNSEYQQLVQAIQEQMGSKCASLEPSPMNKIHLAYNVLKSLSRPALKRMREKAESTIDIYDWIKTGGSWRLTLYEVMLESQVVGVQQQLIELKSWPIQQKQESGPANFLPVSLRIKLSYLSSWFKSPLGSSSFFSSGLKDKDVLPPVADNAMVLRKTASRPKPALGYQTL